MTTPLPQAGPVPPQGDRGRPTNVWLLLALALNTGLAVAAGVVWVKLYLADDSWRSDLSQMYTGWSIIRDGQFDRLYDLNYQAQRQRELLGDRDFEDGLLPFNHPPHSALLFSVLANVPRTTAYTIWSAANLGLLATFVGLFLRVSRGWPGEARQLAAATVLAFPSLFVTFQLAQVSLICLVALTGFTVALRERRPVLAACWLALATVKPQFVLVPGVLLLAARRWQELGCFVGIMLVWTGLTTAVMGWGCWAGFLTMVRWTSDQFGHYAIHPVGMFNVKAVLTTVIGSDSPSLINGLTSGFLLAALAVVGRLWAGPWDPASPAFGLRLALSVGLGILANPHQYSADVLVMVLPVMWFLDYRFRRGVPLGLTGRLLTLAPCWLWFDLLVFDLWGLTFRPFFPLMVGFVALLTRDLSFETGLDAVTPDREGVAPGRASI